MFPATFIAISVSTLQKLKFPGHFQKGNLQVDLSTLTWTLGIPFPSTRLANCTWSANIAINKVKMARGLKSWRTRLVSIQCTGMDNILRRKFICLGESQASPHNHLKEQCHLSRIFYFFIVLLFYEFLIDSVWLKHINCIIFTFLCIQETTDVRRNHCNSNCYILPRFLHSPCFKYIVYQINSFALIVA